MVSNIPPPQTKPDLVITSDPWTHNSKVASCLFTLGVEFRKDIPVTIVREKTAGGRLAETYVFWFQSKGIWECQKPEERITFCTQDAMREWNEPGSSNLDPRIKEEIRTLKINSENYQRIRDLVVKGIVFYGVRTPDGIRLKSK